MYGYRARIGYTSPPLTTEVFPYEFYRAVPDGVTLVLTTLSIVEMNSQEIDQSYDISIRAAKAMARAGITLMVLGGVPINTSKGYANVELLIKDVEKQIGVPVTTSITAQIGALRMVGGKRLAIGHPFGPDQDAMFHGYADEYGFGKATVLGIGRPAIELGQIGVENTLELGRELKRRDPAADTLWLPCPHWATAPAIDVLEKELGVNVVTANQAIVWDALRRSGIKDSVSGHGTLLRDH